MTPNIADDTASGDPTYAFKPSLIGSMCEFALRPDALEWQIGRRSGRVRYETVRAIRLSYRPVTIACRYFSSSSAPRWSTAVGWVSQYRCATSTAISSPT